MILAPLKGLAGFLCLLSTMTVWAHGLGESYIFLNVTEQKLNGRIEVTLMDAAKVVAADANADGVTTQAEFDVVSDRVYAYLQPRLSFYSNSLRHGIVIKDHEFLNVEERAFAKLNFNVPSLSIPPESIDVEYRFLFDSVEPTHRGLLVVESNTRTGISDNESHVSLIFGPGTERQSFNLDGDPWYKVFAVFIKHGVWHILIGFDHILFLVSLLLPSVLFLRSRKWIPVDTFREALVYVVKVVTLFTVAHTITLSLATLHIIQLPSQWVESIIAISIAVVALNNIVPFLHGKTWIVVFCFGLFHGLGFASVLEPLGINQQSQITALLGFNVGVELGQLAIILTMFPLLYVMRQWRIYQPIVLQLGSLGLIAVSLFWFIQRTVDIPFLSAETLGIALAYLKDLFIS